MNESRIRTLEQVRQFLSGTPRVSFSPQGGDAERYSHINEVLRRFGYAGLGKSDRGLILRYLQTTSGYSRAQITRLVARALKGERLHKHYLAPKQAFARRFLAQDIVLLATVDRDPVEHIKKAGHARPFLFAAVSLIQTARRPAT